MSEYKTCKRIKHDRKAGVTKYCGGEMVTIDTGNAAILTRYCQKCGLIENVFASDILKKLNDKAIKVGEDGTIEEKEMLSETELQRH